MINTFNTVILIVVVIKTKNEPKRTVNYWTFTTITLSFLTVNDIAVTL